MATHDSFTDRLSDYLDDEDLVLEERQRIGAHLAGCASCRTTLEDLREVARRATTLTDSAPTANLWPGIADRIGGGAPPRIATWRALRIPRRFTFTLPQLVAASLALMVLSGGAVWLVRHGGSQTQLPPVVATVHAPTAPGEQPDIQPATFADAPYNEAIADLERILQDEHGKLDPETVRVLRDNLRAIDEAIAQCRRALADDPGNAYLTRHLADAKKRKLALLRRATALADSES